MFLKKQTLYNNKLNIIYNIYKKLFQSKYVFKKYADKLPHVNFNFLMVLKKI